MVLCRGFSLAPISPPSRPHPAPPRPHLAIPDSSRLILIILDYSRLIGIIPCKSPRLAPAHHAWSCVEALASLPSRPHPAPPRPHLAIPDSSRLILIILDYSRLIGIIPCKSPRLAPAHHAWFCVEALASSTTPPASPAPLPCYICVIFFHMAHIFQKMAQTLHSLLFYIAIFVTAIPYHNSRHNYNSS